MPVLVYCVTARNEGLSAIAGVADSMLKTHDSAGLRFYWSEVSNPEAWLSKADSLKKAASEFQQVLRQILSAVTPLPFPFPTLFESISEMEDHLGAEHEEYRAALERIGDGVQYEIAAGWAVDEEADLATPVTGKEYSRRRQEEAGRTAALDNKLRNVTGGVVREWRMRQERKKHRWFALVSRKDRDAFVASLRSAGPSEGVRLRVSGPWPPGEFITPAQDGR